MPPYVPETPEKPKRRQWPCGISLGWRDWSHHASTRRGFQTSSRGTKMSPLADTRKTSPTAPSPQKLRNPSARPHGRSARQTRERRAYRLRSRKKRLIRNHIAADLTWQNSRQRFRAAVERSRTIRDLGLYRIDPRVNAIARPRGGQSRGGVKPSLETATRWRNGIGHRPRLRTKTYTSSARRAAEETGAAEAELLSLSLSSDPESRGADENRGG